MPIGQTSTTPLATVVMASPAAEKPSETILHLATDNDLQDENSQITLYVSGETSINNNEEKFVGCSLNTTLNRHTPMAIFIGCFLTFLFLLGLSIDRNNKIQATIDTQDELDLQHSWLPNVNEQLKGTYLCESRKFRHHWHFLSEQKRNILHQTNNNVTTVLRVEVEIHEQDEADYSATYTLVGTVEFDPNTSLIPDQILFKGSTAQVKSLQGVHKFSAIDWILKTPTQDNDSSNKNNDVTKSWPLFTSDKRCKPPTRKGYLLKEVQQLGN
eukprot:TRINITY_DN906_c0_g1_i1.p1 TRINITY_DN906_c0_g1~~TRINITY_DN906_c0_g1_i1.p1  ORF type:complete len:271 (-),score=48.68 TRINITY_DN906_c0_g1_i1:275-1087(-)